MSTRTKHIRALILDLDGVITDTAMQHYRAWKRLFDPYVREHATGNAGRPLTLDDYRVHVDGKPRLEGADSFLRSRGIRLDVGNPDDEANADTLWGLGNRKNGYYHEILEDEGVEPFPDALHLLRQARECRVPCAVVSSSRNAGSVVKNAGIGSFFQASVDGRDLDERGLAGKPQPEMFLEAARQLGVAPEDAAVLEDAGSGVQAGRRGGFGRVIGVARNDDGQALLDSGADLVISRLDELDLSTFMVEETP